MILIESLAFILGFYIFSGISVYTYGVFKYFQLTETWNLKIENGYISDIFKYPKWMLFWLELVVKKIKK